MDEKNTKVLDPDDPLMKRFQDALNEHLLRVDNKLSQEILEMVIKKNKQLVIFTVLLLN